MSRPPAPTVTKVAALASLCLAILCATMSLHAAPVSAPAPAPASAPPAPPATATPSAR